MSLEELDLAEANARDARAKLAKVIQAAETLAERDRTLYVQLQGWTTAHGKALADAAMGDDHARGEAESLHAQIMMANAEREAVKVAAVEIAERRKAAHNVVTLADNAVRAAMRVLAEPIAAKLSTGVREAFAHAYALQRQWAELCFSTGLPWDGANVVRHRLPGTDDDVSDLARRAGVDPDTMRPRMPLAAITAAQLRDLAKT